MYVCVYIYIYMYVCIHRYVEHLPYEYNIVLTTLFAVGITHD